MRTSTRYDATRKLLRHMLSKKTGIAPADLKFALTEYKKPILMPTGSNAKPWHFSISHSKNTTAIALAKSVIGIDIEHTTATPAEIIIPLFVREDERYLLRSESDFYQIWCVKEAVLKALGTGFYVDPLHLHLKPLSSTCFETCIQHQRYIAQTSMLTPDIQLAIAQRDKLTSYELNVLVL